MNGFVKAVINARSVQDLKTLNLLIVGTRGDKDQIKKLAEAITSADG